MADTMYAQIVRYKSLVTGLEVEIEVCDEQVSNLKDQVAEKEILETSYKKQAKRNKFTSKLWKGTTIGLFVIATVEAGVLYFTKKAPN